MADCEYHRWVQGTPCKAAATHGVVIVALERLDGGGADGVWQEHAAGRMREKRRYTVTLCERHLKALKRVYGGGPWHRIIDGDAAPAPTRPTQLRLDEVG